MYLLSHYKFLQSPAALHISNRSFSFLPCRQRQNHLSTPLVPNNQQYEMENQENFSFGSRIVFRDRNCSDENRKNSGPRKQMVMAVEGNIGAGKSTLLKLLGNCNDVDVVMEPVDDWCNVAGQNMLELLYKDPRRWSYAFNSNAMLARMKMHCDDNSKKPTKIIERSLYATRHIFVEQSYRAGDIMDIELAMLDELFNSLRGYCNVKLDKIVYLRAEPEICLRRIHKRGRKEEANLSLEFLSSLHDLYDDWLMKKSGHYNIPVVTIDANSHIHDRFPTIHSQIFSQVSEYV